MKLKDNIILQPHMVAAFNQAATEYDSVAVLQQEVGASMLQRLDYIKIKPQKILDLGAGTGFMTKQIAERFPDAEIYALDVAEQMLQYNREQTENKLNYICADLNKIPLPDNSIDFIYSNMVIHWVKNIDHALLEIRRVLTPEGLILFSTLGPDTLKELRASWAKVDDYTHVNNFMDLHDVGDAMLRAKFSDPVMDAEYIQLLYRDVKTLMQELKAIGAHNVNSKRNKGLTGKNKLKTMLAAYEEFKNSDGFYPATYEVVYGHGWGPKVTVDNVLDEYGEVGIPISQLRGRR